MTDYRIVRIHKGLGSVTYMHAPPGSAFCAPVGAGNRGVVRGEPGTSARGMAPRTGGGSVLKLRKVLIYFASITVVAAVAVSTGFAATVYVTKSGTKYHKENCSYLKSSKIMISG